MWPFAGISLSTATLIGSIANWALLVCLLGGMLATFVIVQTTDVKEEHWAEDRKHSSERIAELNNGTARLQADNLVLQTVLLPRHVGLIGLDQEPPAKKWFAGFERWAGTKLLIQVIQGDPEAQNLANEIAIVLSKFGWIPEFIDEKRSGVSLNLSEGLSVLSPSSHKAWDPKNEVQKTFAALGEAAISLARALTNAGLGVGSYPVVGANGAAMVVDFPPESEGEAHNPFRNFSPRLDGVYLQVGSRPVGATMAWIKQGRPDILGNKAADAAPAEAHK
ncbi:hypothetical protein [Bradyrhizobium sp. CCGB20]|uniref:hypothetical protein n=1 Tax=Bradyrhizobium sp. CCGB20 TaxID=2949633 RepID=UPI0020B3D588|nr:hypothetical protein [Bradyrhizobium sp. CCGB20]MCP3399857.1 hypothetical protein [Bradyrhizobium sp. CCGB20]